MSKINQHDLAKIESRTSQLAIKVGVKKLTKKSEIKAFLIGEFGTFNLRELPKKYKAKIAGLITEKMNNNIANELLADLNTKDNKSNIDLLALSRIFGLLK